MFGLSSFLYVRDYIQGLQSQQKPLTDEQVSDEKGPYSFSQHFGSPILNERGEVVEPIVGEALPAKLSSPLSHNSSLPQILGTRTNTPLRILERNLDYDETFIRDHGEFTQNCGLLNRQRLLSDLSFTYPPQVNIDSPRRVDFLQSWHLSSNPFQLHRGERGWVPQDVGERSSGFPANRCIIKDPSFPQRRTSPLSPRLGKIDPTSRPAAQGGSKSRRLSPLCESNGNTHHNCGKGDPGPCIPKTRSASKIDLHSSKLPDSFCQSPIPEGGLRSSLLPRSGFAVDYNSGAAFLRRYRAPSNPELHLSQLSSPFYRIRPVPRSISLTSLRHLPQNKRILYIGINNCKIFLSSSLDHSVRPLAVAYRAPQGDERNIPIMAPSGIIGSVAFNREITPADARLCKNGDLKVSLSVIDHQSLIRCDTARRSASVIATAGSEDSAPNQMNDVSQQCTGAGPTILEEADTPQSIPSGHISTGLNKESIPRGVHGTVFFPYLDTTRLTRPKAGGFFVGLSKELKLLGLENKRSREAFDDRSQLGICTQTPCTILMEDDKEYTCWHLMKSAKLRERRAKRGVAIKWSRVSGQEPVSSIAYGRICNRAKRSVSFAEGAGGSTPQRKSPICRHTIPLPDQFSPSPLIPPKLRGPSSSKEFEENMLTLPMPPVEHSIPFGGRSSSTISGTHSGNRSIISLSKKPRGFWTKLGDAFKGCFGAF